MRPSTAITRLRTSFGTYEVTGSFIGYTAQTVQVTVANEDIIIQNFTLFPATYVIEEAAEVVAKVDRSRDVYMENIKKKTQQASTTSRVNKSGEPVIRMLRQPCSGVPGVSTVGNFVCPWTFRSLHQDHFERSGSAIHQPEAKHH